ncbi:hypothetical protein GOV05_05430 [Candidatus Woesearchaeota archaeon]|nr:hypothetical protein [Candidatus Woesearchaeota archaeon]
MDMFFLLLINIVLNIIIVISGTIFLFKAINHIKLEVDFIRTKRDHGHHDSHEIMKGYMTDVKRTFFVSFYILELALLTYFIFWGILFYTNIKIT